MRFTFVWILIAITFFSVLPLSSISAQEPEPTITATVSVENTPIYWQPSSFYGDINIKSTLDIGETVIPQDLYGTIYTYVIVPAYNLSGWILTENLVFSHTNWQNILPGFTGGIDTITQRHNGQLFSRAGGSGGYANINVRAEPFYGAELIGKIPAGHSITILGRAEIDGRTASYFFVRDNVTGLEGWAHVSGISFRHVSLITNDGLNIVYELNLTSELAHLPRAKINLESYYGSRINLRASPSLDSEVINAYTGYYYRTLWVAVHGRNTNEADGWAYVTVLQTGKTGWIYDPAYEPYFLIYNGNIDRSTLPIIIP